MRLELQQIGTLCVALLLGGSISLSLFFVMIFLIEPERPTNSHMPRPHLVTFVATVHENKTKKSQSKSIEMPKSPSNPKLTPMSDNVPQKVVRKKTSVHLPKIGPIGVYSAGQEIVQDANIDTEENYSPKDSRKVLFNRAERKYLRSKKEKTLLPERVRIIGGEEIDRIGNTCYAVSGADGSGGSDTGQTAIERDQNFAMRSLSAHQVPCNKTDNSLAQDFLKQLEKRGLIMAPAPLTN